MTLSPRLVANALVALFVSAAILGGFGHSGAKHHDSSYLLEETEPNRLLTESISAEGNDGDPGPILPNASGRPDVLFGPALPPIIRFVTPAGRIIAPQPTAPPNLLS